MSRTLSKLKPGINKSGKKFCRFSMPPQDAAWLSKVRRLVRQSISSPSFNIEHLAMQMLMSERQFYRKVKQLTHCTPNQLIQVWRLQKAKEILESGQVDSVSHLAQRVGYAKPAYFSKLFQRHYGQSPGTYIDAF